MTMKTLYTGLKNGYCAESSGRGLLHNEGHMKTLYECIKIACCGESYVRCYVWTDQGADHAMKRACERLSTELRPVSPEDVDVTALFTSQDDDFATRSSDCGWDR